MGEQSLSEFMLQNLQHFWDLTGFNNATWEHFVMLAVGMFFLCSFLLVLVF